VPKQDHPQGRKTTNTLFVKKIYFLALAKRKERKYCGVCKKYNDSNNKTYSNSKEN
jgi:hypothetical protein